MSRFDKLTDSLLLEGESLSAPTRRGVLAGLGVGAAGALAGCIGDSDGDINARYSDEIDPGELDAVEGEALTLVTTHSPDDVTFLGTGAFPFPSIVNPGFAYPPFANRIMNDYGMWGPWSNNAISSGDAELLLYDDVSIESDEINVEIRDDAVWSNGDELTGRDVLTTLVCFRMFPSMDSVPEVRAGDIDSAGLGTVAGLTDVEYDETSATLISESGYWEDFREQDIWEMVLTKWGEWGGIHQHSRIEPHDEWSQVIWDHWEASQDGDADPWGDDPGEHITALTMEAAQPEWAEIQRDPERTAFSGPWKLAELTPNEIRLSPNDYHRNYDDLNWDEVILEWRPEERAVWAQLQAERVDFYDGFYPTDVAEDLPSIFEDRLVETNSGLLVWLDHSSEMFENVRARQAFMHLIDTEAVAEVAGADVNEAILTPGADLWGADEWLSEEFIEENLRTYEVDFEEAAALLQDAGWSEEAGEWFLPSGERAEVEIPTTANTPRWELAVRDQLQDFGIESSVSGMDGASMSEQRLAGELDFYHPGSDSGRWYQVGHFEIGLAQGWMFTTVVGHWATMHNIFPQEQIDEAEWQPNPASNQDLGHPVDDEQYGVFSVEAPPVGEWDGDVQEWNAPHMGMMALRPYVGIERQELFEQLAWLTNWHLPVLPLTNERKRMAVNTGEWIWPSEDSEDWASVGIDEVQGQNLVGLSRVWANPDR